MRIDLYMVEVEEADGSIRREYFGRFGKDEARKRAWQLRKAGYTANWNLVWIHDESDLLNLLNGKVNDLIH